MAGDEHLPVSIAVDNFVAAESGDHSSRIADAFFPLGQSFSSVYDVVFDLPWAIFNGLAITTHLVESCGAVSLALTL